MKIALVRHGQTEQNSKDLIQGRSNHLLNDVGRGQALALKEKIKDKHFDVCYTSPLIRCVETAMILIGDRVFIVRDDRLMERDMGELEGHPREEYNAYLYWDYDLNKTDRGVEGLQEVFQRCQEFLDYVKEKNSGEDILIVTHGAVYRALRYLLKGHKLKGKMFDGFIPNCQYEEFEIK